MTKAQAQKVGSRVTRVIQNTSSVTFRCKSNSDGQTVRDIIQAAFHPKRVTRYNYDLEPFLTVGMSEWKEFRAKFSSSVEAEDCFNEVEAAIVSYQNSGYDPDLPSYQNGNYEQEATGTGDTSKSRDWTTYIIIGAAAVVILLLLWDRKRK